MLAAFSSSAQAHHSFSMFDADKTTSFAATVKSFDMSNPHSWLQAVTTTPSGASVEWSLEMGDPAQLIREGWTKDIVKPGDKVTVWLHPLRDGSHGGQLMALTLPDGRQLEADIATGGLQKLTPP